MPERMASRCQSARSKRWLFLGSIRIEAYVEDFAEAGKFLSEPMRDLLFAAGDQRFQPRSHEELFEKRADRCMILASHILLARVILHRGPGKVFTDLDSAFNTYDGL